MFIRKTFLPLYLGYLLPCLVLAQPAIAVRLQDSREFQIEDPQASTFDALAPAEGDTIDVTTTSRWAGVLDGAPYRIEVPADWNGRLVMFAHGYRGTNLVLAPPNTPPIRRHLLQAGYAWAASSYSRNFYDVRVGIEDTNALALAFSRLAETHGRPLAPPTKLYIMGVSMGGHIAAAAVEREVLESANHRVDYAAALPLCGAIAPRELFNAIGGMGASARGLTGFTDFVAQPWAMVEAQARAALFTSYPSQESPNVPMLPTALGTQWFSVIKHLTGGERPLFELATTRGGSLSGPLSSFSESDDGLSDVYGIVSGNLIDTTGFTYVIDGDPAASAQLNATAPKLVADADPNPPRADGLRWVPLVNGEITVPVLTVHTIGDLFVPINLETIYAQRVVEQGNASKLVQRVVRGIAHCDFTEAEIATAFDDLVNWEQGGAMPAGDDVLTPGVMAAPTYGCMFTDNRITVDDRPAVRNNRQLVNETAACPAPN